jgi:hypothetical protein
MVTGDLLMAKPTNRVGRLAVVVAALQLVITQSGCQSPEKTEIAAAVGSSSPRRSKMSPAIDRLAQLQRELDRRSQDEWEGYQWRAKVSVSQADGLIVLNYYGGHRDGPLHSLFETLALPEVAGVLGSLSLAGEDEGANGTKDWDFSDLLARKVTFPKLHTLSIELYEGQHNRPVVARNMYDEDGELAQWLDHAPQLRSLTTPSAPDARFFKRAAHPLRSLRVQAGYATQRFIPNLAQSSCFPRLEELDWTEIEALDQDAEFEYNLGLSRSLGHPVDLEKMEKLKAELKEEGRHTSFEEYEALLRWTACPPKVALRDPVLTSDQVVRLKKVFHSRHPQGSLSIVSPHTDPYWSPLNRKNWKR